MPNPMKKFFRRPAVRRVKKVASRQYRKLFPERGFYDIGKYRDPMPEWLSKQIRLEDAAYEHGLQPKPYRGRRHSLEYRALRPGERPYRSFEGYMPFSEEVPPVPQMQEMAMVPMRRPRSRRAYLDPSISMSNLSKGLDRSQDDTFEDYDDSSVQYMSPDAYQDFRPPGVSTPTRLTRSATTSPESTSHRELMLMLDQLEVAELERIQKDLRQFQTSRRKLVFNVSSLSATSSPPASLMKPTAPSISQAGPS